MACVGMFRFPWTRPITVGPWIPRVQSPRLQRRFPKDGKRFASDLSIMRAALGDEGHSGRNEAGLKAYELLGSIMRRS